MSGCGPQLRKRIARPLSTIRLGPVCALRRISKLYPREMEQERSTLNQTQLVDRVTSLEAQLKELTQKYKILQKSTVLTEFPESAKENQLRPKRNFDSSRYSTRFIALKFAYLGQRYNGFEHHVNNITPLPTIEEVLWRALTKAKLLVHTGTPPEDPDQVNWEGCEYSKCGRTDRGVSAFGQVVGLRVRSNQPLQQCNGDVDKVASEDVQHFDPIRDELPYVQILNRLLPSDIRVLAWCPNPPKDFSARFSCRERRYRYFFTQPAFAPTPGAWGLSLGMTNQANAKRREGWLDLDAMREAARRFEGVHDFRNFCKVDASKQITNFERKIFRAEIIEVSEKTQPASYVTDPSFSEFGREDARHEQVTNPPRTFAFVLHGSAFLWHQVRHMMAILFLVGQGLELPEVITELLDISKNPTKPIYEMAEDTPLVLWDCIFPQQGATTAEDSLQWVYAGDDKQLGGTFATRANGKYGLGGTVDEMWQLWRQKKIEETLAGELLNIAARSGNIESIVPGLETSGDAIKAGRNSQRVFFGADCAKLKGKYRPLSQRSRMESVEVINARYVVRKGGEGSTNSPQESTLILGLQKPLGDASIP